MGVVYMASKQEIQFFSSAVVKFTQIFFSSSPEHHLTLLLPFLPLMVDSTSRIYYLRRNLQRNWVVGCQVEVTNGHTWRPVDQPGFLNSVCFFRVVISVYNKFLEKIFLKVHITFSLKYSNCTMLSSWLAVSALLDLLWTVSHWSCAYFSDVTVVVIFMTTLEAKWVNNDLATSKLNI